MSPVVRFINREVGNANRLRRLDSCAVQVADGSVRLFRLFRNSLATASPLHWK